MKVLITTVGKNTSRLETFIEYQYNEVYVLLSANEKNLRDKIKKEIENFFPQIQFSFDKNILEVDPDNIESIFKISKDLIIRLNKENTVVINPSGGSTAMRLGLYNAAKITNSKIEIVYGERDDSHQLISTRIKTINEETIDLYKLILRIRNYLSLYEYGSVLAEIRNNNFIKIKEKKILETLEYIFVFFSLWDRFEFEEANTKLNNLPNYLSKKNKEFLIINFKKKSELLNNSLNMDSKVDPIWIGEFWFSALRSLKKGHYPESLLKIIRFLECILQNILNKSHNIDTTKKGSRLTLEESLKKLNILHKDSNLKISEYFINKSEFIITITKLRNISIFAHGYSTIKKFEIEKIIKEIENDLIPLLRNKSISEYEFGVDLYMKQLPNSLNNIEIHI